MIKVVHITSAHPPFDKRIFIKECRSLAQAGYDVVFIAPHNEDVKVEGVTIRHFIAPRNRIERFLRSAGLAFFAAWKEKGDLYHFHDPDLLFTGLLLKLTGKKVIYDPHEDHPADILGKEWIPLLLRRPLSWSVKMMETLGGACFDAITPATGPIARRFPPNKTTVVHNFPRLEEFGSSGSQKAPQSRNRVMLAAGLISISRGIWETLDALLILEKDFPDIQLIIAGNFISMEEEKRIKQHPGWNKVNYIGWVARQEVAELMETSGCGLVLFHPGPNHTESYPTKLFEFMASGLPLVVSNFPLWRELVEIGDCGITVDPQKALAIAEGVRRIFNDTAAANRMSANGRIAAQKIFNWENEETKLLQVYRRILG